jgi:rod shape determining protein RodA
MTDLMPPVSTTLRQAPPSRSRRRGLRARLWGRDGELRNLDGMLIAAVVSLGLIGCVLVWAATRQPALDHGLNPRGYLYKDLLNLAIGLVLAAVTARLPHDSLRAYAPVFYVGSVLGLLAVLTPLGSTINGAKSWIVLGAGFEVQPAEFAKIALVVGMALLLGDRRDSDAPPDSGDVLLVLALAAVPAVLVLLQPALGMIILFVFIILGVLTVGGASARWVLGLLAAGAVFITLLLSLHLLKPYQAARLTNFAHPSAATSTTGYNVDQAKTAIGSGGLLGQGLFHGQQTDGEFVPEQQTDFIFTVAGEELGFVGSAGIVALLGVVLWRGWVIGRRAIDAFGRILVGGILSWFAAQAFINIGMTLGIMPVAGLPLPFVSYGGSAMFVNMIAIGLLLNVDRRSRRGA